MKSIRHTLGHLISCKEASHLVSQMQDRDLTASERVKLKLHLAACKACSAFERQLRLMREAMRRYRE
jgi:Putative zinc-finger